MASSKILALAAMALFACFAVDTASAAIVKYTQSQGGGDREVAYAAGSGCDVNFHSGTNQVSSFVRYDCTSSGDTITRTHYSDCACATATGQVESVTSGTEYPSGSGMIWNCDLTQSSDTAISHVQFTDASCSTEPGDACGGTTWIASASPICLKGNPVSSSQYQGSYQVEYTAGAPGTMIINQYSSTDCSGSGTPAPTLLVSGTFNPYQGNSCQASTGTCNDNTTPEAAFVYSTATNPFCSAEFQAYGASNSASSLVASSLAALFAVTALFL